MDLGPAIQQSAVSPTSAPPGAAQTAAGTHAAPRPRRTAGPRLRDNWPLLAALALQAALPGAGGGGAAPGDRAAAGAAPPPGRPPPPAAGCGRGFRGGGALPGGRPSGRAPAVARSAVPAFPLLLRGAPRLLPAAGRAG